MDKATSSPSTNESSEIIKQKLKAKLYFRKKASKKIKPDESSTDSSTSDDAVKKVIKGKNKISIRNRRKRKESSSSTSSSSSSSSTTNSSDTSSAEERKKRKKRRKRKFKELKELSRERRINNVQLLNGPDKSDDKNNSKNSDEGPSMDVPIELMDTSNVKSMAPMTKEEWEKKQSVVKRVYDESTGRHRLIKGDGEVVEEIVSKNRHKEINRQATKGDGDFFQKMSRKK